MIVAWLRRQPGIVRAEREEKERDLTAHFITTDGTVISFVALDPKPYLTERV
jgi:hypothetical protein